MPNPLFQLDRYLIRRKVLQIFGASFHVYDGDDRVVAFSRQKAFKLKEDVRVYADDSETREILSIRARSWIDFSAAYDIYDAETGEKAGAVRRRGFKSLVRDAWEVLDAHDRVLTTLQEDSMGMALARRFLSDLIPQTFHIDDGGRPPVFFKQRFNPFIYKLEVEIPPGATIDRRLIFGIAVLIAAIERRQTDYGD